MVGGEKLRIRASVEEARRMLKPFKCFAHKRANQGYFAEVLNAVPKDAE
ncbi:MAG: hypothetical protein JSW47_19015 [Phycisphaerales bacterium]|nr:MAG: hypothetical protein JSW47_19015 [Phycisphaerales bacterium]